MTGGRVLAIVACMCGACGSPSKLDDVAPTMAGARAAERGAGMPRDFSAAADAYTALCKDGSGELEACFELTDAILAGRGVAFDLARLQQLQHAVCRRGDALSCVMEAYIELTRPDTSEQRRAELAPTLEEQGAQVEQACEHGDGRACEWIAGIRGSEGGEADDERRAKFSKACHAGRIDACGSVMSELLACADPDEHDPDACEARALAIAPDEPFHAERQEAATKLVDECGAGDARACNYLPTRRVPLAALCAAHDYDACGQLGCIGDDAAAAAARANGVPAAECSVAGARALFEWRRTPNHSKFEPLAAEPGAPVGPRPTPPFEAVRFARHGGRTRHDWPRFDVYNMNDHAVTELAVCLYAYRSSDQLARVVATRKVSIAPDARIELALDDAIADALPDGTDDVLIDYDRVRFEGDAAASVDESRCPAQRPYDREAAPLHW
ncbi:MAG TPA: hypothetical protein VMJ10_25895 [Kofleriaceae bacterium]|nr:hypothetical protein [Kofleriaceae bacterium]